MIGIFNRSYYEEVLVVRVHPELLGRGKPVGGDPTGDRVWRDRYEDINAFEHHLDRNGTRVVKIYLHVSKEEQRRRFLERLDDQAENWKLSAGDVAGRGVPGRVPGRLRGRDHGHVHPVGPVVCGARRPQVRPARLVGGIIVETIHAMDLRPPVLSEPERDALAVARADLAAD